MVLICFGLMGLLMVTIVVYDIAVPNPNTRSLPSDKASKQDTGGSASSAAVSSEAATAPKEPAVVKPVVRSPSVASSSPPVTRKRTVEERPQEQEVATSAENVATPVVAAPTKARNSEGLIRDLRQNLFGKKEMLRSLNREAEGTDKPTE